MDESENTAPKPFEYCHKRNRPCSKPKGHPSKCDSKRPLEHRHQFWLMSAKHQRRQEQENGNNVALESTQQSLEPGVTQTPVRESIVPAKHQKTTVTIARTKKRPKKSARSKTNLHSKATAIPLVKYTERYKTKQKGEYEELLVRKKDLETEVTRLETEVGRLRLESAWWQQVSIRTACEREQLKAEREELRIQREELKAKHKW